MRLREGTAIVSGASSGIGEATARLLAGSGIDLVLTAAEQDEGELSAMVTELRAAGTKVVSVVGDLADTDHTKALVGTALAEYGQLDYLVSNAGMPSTPGGFFAEDLADFDRLLAVNVRGPYQLAVEAAQAMVDTGAIVCTAGVSSWLGDEDDVAYSTASGGILMTVRTLGLELAPYGVRVNGVAPGRIRTPMTQSLLDDAEAWAKARSGIPLDRVGEPQEVAEVIAFLLSDESSFMFGSVITVDGGASAGTRSSGWTVADRFIDADPAPHPQPIH